MTDIHAIYQQGLACLNNEENELAVVHFRQAAEAGLPEAQFHLGLSYEYGKGISQNFAAAATWYRKAIDNGDLASMVNLSLMMLRGKGMLPDEPGAFILLRQAAESEPCRGQ